MDGLSAEKNKPNKKRNTDIKHQVFRFIRTSSDVPNQFLEDFFNVKKDLLDI